MELETLKSISGQFLTGDLASPQAICDSIANEVVVSGLIGETNSARLGIYLVSPNAGVWPAVAFWKLACTQGPSYLSPLNFPWTLANGPAAYIARKLHAHGPNITLVGKTSEPAINQARYDLEAGLCEKALILLIEFGSTDIAPTLYDVQVLEASS